MIWTWRKKERKRIGRWKDRDKLDGNAPKQLPKFTHNLFLILTALRQYITERSVLCHDLTVVNVALSLLDYSMISTAITM